MSLAGDDVAGNFAINEQGKVQVFLLRLQPQHVAGICQQGIKIQALAFKLHFADFRARKIEQGIDQP